VRVVNRRLPRSLQAARAVITDSFAVRNEILARYGVRADRVHAVPLGVAARFHPRAAPAAPNRFGLSPGEYLLSVGTLEPRKNLVRTLQAYSRLPERLRQRFPLAVVGAAGWHESSIFAGLAPLERKGEVRVLSYVGDEELAELYCGARALLYPSLYEGFGFPIVEAMASGTPVITSSIGCMKEVAEGAALLVDPLDTDAIAAGMSRLLEDDREAARLRAEGLARAARYTWEACARQTLDVYRRALAA
jgi:alpha-1,3-rhamnosyl/mannosyltransferase